MKNLLIVLAIFCALKTNGQDYFISFSGTGASTNIATIKVENLTAGTSLTLNGSDILHLTSIITAVNPTEDTKSSEIKIYPNPMTDNSIIEVFPSEAGYATISVYDIMGVPLAQTHSYLENSKQEFRLSGIKSGIYLINVRGASYQYSGKLLCVANVGGSIALEKISSVKSSYKNEIKMVNKGLQVTVDMAYTDGDRLKFTAISGNYSTVMVDIPFSNRIIDFNFIACTDGDNNNYPVVEIGGQTWMGENLKTTKYVDKTDIPLVSDDIAWDELTSPGYCWVLNNAALKEIYGGLYNFYVVDPAGNGNKNVCPTGWHVPTDEQWTILTSYLGESVAGAKLRESGTAHWKRPNSTSTNESGFTALPGGYRAFYLGFLVQGEGGCWWSATEFDNASSWERGMNIVRSDVYRAKAGKKYGFSIRCLKGEMPLLPTLTTTIASNISPSTATSGGNVTSDGGATVTARGVCWSTSSYPTITDNKTVDGEGMETFTSLITGLMPGTTYYLRAYATNSAGTNYGNQVSFNTKIADVEGNIYNTVTIGTQVWMSENLKATKYRNGDLIGTTSPATKDISGETSPKYQWSFDGNESNVATYGRLYTWDVVHDSRKLCPTGWHVPADSEWTTLTDYLGGVNIAGGKLKETGIIHWQTPNTGATNESGFTAISGGDRNVNGTFGYFGSEGTWWSSTEFNTNNAWYRCLKYNVSSVNRGDFDKPNGFSVRCVKD